MASNDYAFVTRWRVVGTVAEVKEILGDAAWLPRWWPSVYLEARVLVPGDPAGVGKTVELLTQGWLPYRLRWRFVTTEAGRDIADDGARWRWLMHRLRPGRLKGALSSGQQAPRVAVVC